MNLLRRLLYSILGKTLYFKTVSKSFLFLYRVGILSVFKKFKTHYLVRKLIYKDDTIIDIGANFGYYTSIFARKAGKNGKIYAVEPVQLYRDILLKNTARFPNIEIIPYALSDREGESSMGIASEKKYRHGLTRLMTEDNSHKIDKEYSVSTKTPETVFGKLEKLDYIKCDIEGHEIKVIPGFKSLIEKYKPVVQIELEKANFDSINSFLCEKGYKAYTILEGKAVILETDMEIINDIIYIPEEKMMRLNKILNL